MKKTLLLIVLFSVQSFSQKLTTQQLREELDKAEISKSGNYKELLASFFQLGIHNLTGNDKDIAFNTTLFKLKAKANPELLQDINFKNEQFSRNFQINFKLNLNDEFKYKGFVAGATYAIINGRDKQIAVLANTLYGESHQKMMTIIEEIQSELLTNLTDSNRQQEMDAIEKAIESILTGQSIENNPYYDKIITAFNLKTKNNKDFIQKDLKDFVNHLQNLKSDEYNKIDAKPLWIVSANGTANASGKFDAASLSTVFLKGNASASHEIDIRAKLSYYDTIAITPLPRTDFKSTAGINFKLAKNKKNMSFFEVKAAIEYDHIFNNVPENEKQNYFMGNAEIRIRLMDDLWFPITIKYDVENANFLGFLNLTYNFGGFTNQK